MKITKYFLSIAAAAGMVAGCYKPEMVQISAPEDVKAPVLAPIEGPIEITPSNLGLDKVTFTWSLADFGAATQVSYSIEAAKETAPDTKFTVTSGITADAEDMTVGELSAEVAYEPLNAILFNDLKLNDGVAENVLFYIGAKAGEYAKVYSAPLKVSCTVTAAEKTYPTLTVAGSYAYNNWTPGKGQFVFDFDGTDTKYSGVIDFGEDVSALQFKFVGSKWGENEFSVPSGEAQAAEAAELPLVAGGGDNISAYTTHRYYSLTLDKGTPKVIKNFSFSSLGVIGDATPTGWDADTDMQFNADKQRFYVDITLIDGTIKFRVDDAWTLEWGGADGLLEKGGANIAVTAGDYRIYVNLNDPANPTYELNAGMYGKEEPVGGTTPDPGITPEPPVMTGWGIVGEVTNWGNLTEDNKYIADIALASDGTYLVAKGVELSGAFKFRKDGMWNYKDDEGNDVQTNLGATGEVEPFELTANTETELVAGGKNFTIAAGTYDVYLDEANAKAWFINDGSYPGGGDAPEVSTWALIGEFNSWSGDYPMYIEGEYHVAKGFVVAADGKMKFRKDGQWNYKDDAGNEIQTNLGGTFAADAELALTGGGSDLNVTAGTYDVYLKVAEDGQSGKAYFMTDGKTPADAGVAPEPEPEPTPDPSAVWGVVGTITSWADNSDINMVEDGDWLVAKGVALTTTDEFKFRTNGTWGTERTTTSADPVAINTEYEAAAGSGNIKVAVDGTYDIYLAKTLDKFYVMTEGLVPGQTTEDPEQPEFEEVESIYGVIGVNNDWTNDIMMYTTPVENLFVARDVTFSDASNSKFKVRKAGAWDNTANFGTKVAGSVAVDHYADIWSDGGSCDITVELGTYDIYLDLANMRVYVMTPGKDIASAQNGTPQPPLTETWYIRGGFNNWAATDDTKMTSEGGFYVIKNFTLATASELKFDTGSWATNRGGTFSNSASGFSVTQGGANISVPAGTYDVYLSGDTARAYFLTPGTTPAN